MVLKAQALAIALSKPWLKEAPAQAAQDGVAVTQL